MLHQDFGINFHHLFAITNLPISRFLEYLIASENYEDYMHALVDAYNPAVVENVMCTNTLSVSWDGWLYDCDFNQMLGIGKRLSDNGGLVHLRELLDVRLDGHAIAVRSHCFACTAGQGSSCGGALAS